MAVAVDDIQHSWLLTWQWLSVDIQTYMVHGCGRTYMAMAVCGHTWMALDAAAVWTWQWLQGVKSQTVAHGVDELEEGERS